MAELERDWTFIDLVEAHELLDALDEAEAKAYDDARRAAAR